MELFVLRHGIAEDKGAHRSDADRALTEEGRKKLTTVLKQAAKAGVAPSLILTSPYVRARQTAEMAADFLKCKQPLVEAKSLTPGHSPQDVWNDVREHRSEESLLLAGHNPLLSQLVGYLLASPALRFDFRKAGLVAVQVDQFRGEPHATLEWILTPKLAGA